MFCKIIILMYHTRKFIICSSNSQFISFGDSESVEERYIEKQNQFKKNDDNIIRLKFIPIKKQKEFLLMLSDKTESQILIMAVEWNKIFESQGTKSEVVLFNVSDQKLCHYDLEEKSMKKKHFFSSYYQGVEDEVKNSLIPIESDLSTNSITFSGYSDMKTIDLNEDTIIIDESKKQKQDQQILNIVAKQDRNHTSKTKNDNKIKSKHQNQINHSIRTKNQQKNEKDIPIPSNFKILLGFLVLFGLFTIGGGAVYYFFIIK